MGVTHMTCTEQFLMNYVVISFVFNCYCRSDNDQQMTYQTTSSSSSIISYNVHTSPGLDGGVCIFSIPHHDHHLYYSLFESKKWNSVVSYNKYDTCLCHFHDVDATLQHSIDLMRCIVVSSSY